MCQRKILMRLQLSYVPIIQHTLCEFNNWASMTRLWQNLLEGSSEFNVEYCVDDRVQETIHITQPDEEREQYLVKMADITVVE